MTRTVTHKDKTYTVHAVRLSSGKFVARIEPEEEGSRYVKRPNAQVEGKTEFVPGEVIECDTEEEALNLGELNIRCGLK